MPVNKLFLGTVPRTAPHFLFLAMVKCYGIKFPSAQCSLRRNEAGEAKGMHSLLEGLPDTTCGGLADATGPCCLPLPFPHPGSLSLQQQGQQKASKVTQVTLNLCYLIFFFNCKDGCQNSPHSCLPLTSACLLAPALVLKTSSLPLPSSFCQCSCVEPVMEIRPHVYNLVYQLQ